MKFPTDLSELVYLGLGKHRRYSEFKTTLVGWKGHTTEFVKIVASGSQRHHLEETYLAGKLYAAVGLCVPAQKLYRQEGNLIMLSRYVKPDATLSRDIDKQVQKGFVMDALLANDGIDIIGILQHHGTVFRAYNDNTLQYQEDGIKKGYSSGFVFGPEVIELDILRKHNDYFRNITDEDICHQIKKYMGKARDAVRQLVQDADLSDLLMARITFLENWKPHSIASGEIDQLIRPVYETVNISPEHLIPILSNLFSTLQSTQFTSMNYDACQRLLHMLRDTSNATYDAKISFQEQRQALIQKINVVEKPMSVIDSVYHFFFPDFYRWQKYSDYTRHLSKKDWDFLQFLQYNTTHNYLNRYIAGITKPKITTVNSNNFTYVEQTSNNSANNVLDPDVILYALDSIIYDAPRNDTEFVVYRGVDVQSKAEYAHSGGYISTSIDYKIAQDFSSNEYPFLLKIIVPKNSIFLFLGSGTQSAFHEEEILLPRNTELIRLNKKQSQVYDEQHPYEYNKPYSALYIINQTHVTPKMAPPKLLTCLQKVERYTELKQLGFLDDHFECETICSYIDKIQDKTLLINLWLTNRMDVYNKKDSSNNNLCIQKIEQNFKRHPKQWYAFRQTFCTIVKQFADRWQRRLHQTKSEKDTFTSLVTNIFYTFIGAEMHSESPWAIHKWNK